MSGFRKQLVSSRVWGWVLGAVVSVVALYLLAPQYWREERLLSSLLFRLRAATNTEPSLPPNLVIFALGDSSTAALQGTDLSLKEWGQIFAYLQKQGVRDILVDKLFSFVADFAETREFVRSLDGGLPVPITGAFYSPVAIPGRQALGEDSPLPVSAASTLLTKPSKLPVYASPQELQRVLTRPGLLNIDSGTVPQFWFTQPGRGLPFAAARLEETGSKHEFGTFPEVSPGRVQINFLSPAKLKGKKLSLHSLLAAARSGEPMKELTQSSVVLLLTAFYTGSTQQISTPFGEQPSGVAQIALVNSVLSNQWLSSVSKPLLVATALTLVAGLSLQLVPSLLWAMVALAGVILVWVGTGALAFLLASTVLPVSLVAVGIALSSAPLLLTRVLARRREHALILNSLEGVVPQKELQALLKSGSRKIREPHNYELSILFLDLVGFSDAAERLSAKESFSLLKDLLAEVTATIHEHGGIIDKTLGDGVLCFFGIGADGKSIAGHADRAVQCALDIQKKSVAMILRSPEGVAVLPFRIGVNSGAVVLGDLGSRTRIDLTVIGSTVNLAKRFETAADPFGVVVGETTFGLLSDPSLLGMAPPVRWFPVKNQAEPVRAYDYKPAVPAKEIASALEKYREFRKLSRQEKRLQPPVPLRVDCGKHGQGELVNYSLNGFCLSLPNFLGTGLSLRCEIVLPDSQRIVVLGQVRWGSLGPNATYLHGVKFLSLPEEQLAEIFRRIHAHRLTKAS